MLPQSSICMQDPPVGPATELLPAAAQSLAAEEAASLTDLLGPSPRQISLTKETLRDFAPNGYQPLHIRCRT